MSEKLYAVNVTWQDGTKSTYLAKADTPEQAKAIIEKFEIEPGATTTPAGVIFLIDDYAYIGGRSGPDEPFIPFQLAI